MGRDVPVLPAAVLRRHQRRALRLHLQRLLWLLLHAAGLHAVGLLGRSFLWNRSCPAISGLWPIARPNASTRSATIARAAAAFPGGGTGRRWTRSPPSRQAAFIPVSFSRFRSARFPEAVSKPWANARRLIESAAPASVRFIRTVLKLLLVTSATETSAPTYRRMRGASVIRSAATLASPRPPTTSAGGDASNRTRAS